MNMAKRLAMAAGAWLQYEFACQRDTLFSERSLVTPISNVLKAVYKHEVHTEFLHPVLAPLKFGPGRRPEVDFAVVEKYPEIICAVETKWVGAVGIKMEDLLWDVLRLELIAHTIKADAYFVLAGRRLVLAEINGLMIAASITDPRQIPLRPIHLRNSGRIGKSSDDYASTLGRFCVSNLA